MIVTSYTSLVIESHRADCAGLVGGLATWLRRHRSPGKPSEVYRDRDTALMHLDELRTRNTEVTDFAHVASGEIRGAA